MASGKKPLKITPEQLEAGKSIAGGFTKQTLKGWGIPWPPPKGWQKALLTGRTIPKRKRSHKQIKAIARQRRVLAQRATETHHREFDREAGRSL
jgi:hypothetical protein